MPATLLDDRALIRLSGDDVRGFLQGLVTNDVLGVLPVWAGLLTPQGKALFDFLVWDDGPDLLIDCEEDAADALTRRLSMYRLRRPIKITREETLSVHWAPAGESGISDPRAADLGKRWLAVADGPSAAAAYRAHRLALGIVEGLAELGSDNSLWLECNAREQNGVSFTKGCYVGQENTARMHHRDKVNRQLAVIASSADPGDQARAWYPDLGLAVVQQRVAASGASD